MAAIELRPYQDDLICKIFESWGRGNRRVLAQLPTGAGKTVIFSAIARKFVQEGMGVLVIAHRQELITQAKEKLEDITGIPAGIIMAGHPVEVELDIQVASIQSLTRRKRFPEAELVIIDEAHHSCSLSYTDTMEAYPNAYILGVTATPCRTDGQGFHFLYDDLITGPSVSALIRQKHLAPFKIFASRPIDTKNIRKTAGDFNLGQLEEAANQVMDDLVPVWKKYAEGKKTVIFAVGVQHSKDVVQNYLAEGISAEHLDGETPTDERKAILERFRTGETTVLSNCGIVTEGFDVPAIEAIQCVRPTTSLVLWLQMVGRSLRPSVGKSHAIIIDHSDNYRRHGLPDEEREWQLEPISLKPGRFILECPECCHCFRALPHEQKPIRWITDATGASKSLHKSTCPHCRAQFEWEQGTGIEPPIRIVEKVAGETVEICLEVNRDRKQIIEALNKTREETGKKAGWVYYRLLELPDIENFELGDWRYVAEILGYKPGWAWKAWNETKAGNVQATALLSGK